MRGDWAVSESMTASETGVKSDDVISIAAWNESDTKRKIAKKQI